MNRNVVSNWAVVPYSKKRPGGPARGKWNIGNLNIVSTQPQLHQKWFDFQITWPPGEGVHREYLALSVPPHHNLLPPALASGQAAGGDVGRRQRVGFRVTPDVLLPVVQEGKSGVVRVGDEDVRGVEGNLAVVVHGEGQVGAGREGVAVPNLGRQQCSRRALERE